MATDILVQLDDHPGELAALGEVLGKHGVNLDGLCGVVNGGGRAEVHLLIDDATAAFDAFAAAGVQVISEQEVLVVDVEDRPGALGEIARRMGDSGVNVTLAYLATRTRLVLAADNLAAAQAALW
jgi:hypothetical protein